MTDTANHATMTLQEVLRGGRQCDEDGAEIIMSRQACIEAADALDAIAREAEEKDAAIQRAEEVARDWLHVVGLFLNTIPTHDVVRVSGTVRDAIEYFATQSARIATLEEALGRIGRNSDVWSEYDMAFFARAALATSKGER